MRKLLKRLGDRHFSFIANNVPDYLPRFRKSEADKNMAKTLKIWKRVALDVDRVSVSKTADSGAYVIKLENSKGKKASLWLESDKYNSRVRSITAY